MTGHTEEVLYQIVLKITRSTMDGIKGLNGRLAASVCSRLVMPSFVQSKSQS